WVRKAPEERTERVSEQSGLDVLFEDSHCLAVNKPAGLTAQDTGSGPPRPSLEALVRAYLDPIQPSGAYVGTLHRIDRPVSGVVLWAKTRKAARRLARQFERRTARKEYWAVVEGVLGTEGGTWEDALLPPGERGLVQVADPANENERRLGRRAITS